MSTQSVIIAGVGHSVPQRVLKNEDFVARGIDTSDEWIRTRTGIRERRLAEPHETTVSFAVSAARAAIKNAKIDAKEIELIIVATLTSDRLMPNTACMVSRELGLESAVAVDQSAACSGFVYGISTAEALMKARGYKTALVIGADRLSSITDWTDRTTCILFGDGAGAAILRTTDEPGVGIIDAILGADGRAGELLTLSRGGTIVMNGKEVFKLAVTVMGNSAQKLLERNCLKKEDINLVIPHQANNRIIEAISDRIKVPMERFFVNLDKYGNTSAASIPIALSEAVATGRLKHGDWLLLVAFGGGLTWGAVLVKWTQEIKF